MSQYGLCDAHRAIAEKVDATELVADLLNQEWHRRAEVITDYMPPQPRDNTRPRIVVGYRAAAWSPMKFLRHSAGPRQGWFWDCYGDDMLSVSLAVIALSEAPATP